MCHIRRWRGWSRAREARRLPWCGARGSATVLLLAVVGAVVVGMAGLTWAIGVFAARAQAQSAADLGALAGAGVLQRGGDACAAAGGVVAANGAQLRECSQVGADVYVTAAVAGRTAEARAGPVRK